MLCRKAWACLFAFLAWLVRPACASAGTRDALPPALPRKAALRSHESQVSLRHLAEEAAQDEEGAKDEEAPEESEEPETEGEKREDTGVACMLLGGVSFVMLLFQMVNWKDDDVRRYAWTVVSNTMGIFLAVLFFQGNREVLAKALTGLPDAYVAVVHIAHCCIYIAAVLLVIGYISGVLCVRDQETDFADLERLQEESWVFADAALANSGERVGETNMSEKVKRIRAVRRGDGDKEDTKSSVYEDENGMEIPVRKILADYEARKHANQSSATLLAHCAGFAAIAAGAHLQQAEVFKRNPFCAAMPILLICTILVFVFRVSSMVREHVKNRSKRMQEDENSKREKKGEKPLASKGLRRKMVDDFCLEAEDDIIALAVSFLTVQVIRFALTGQLPNEEGVEDSLKFKLEMTWWRPLQLFAIGVACIVLAIVLPLVVAWREKLAAKSPPGHRGAHHETHQEHGHERSWDERLLEVTLQTLTMMCAWCVMWGLRWSWIAHEEELGANVHSNRARIIMAVLLSMISFFLVVTLDKLADSAEDGSMDSLVQSIVSAVSLLVGFVWEHSFDGAVTSVSQLNAGPDGKGGHPRTTKFLLGLSVVALLFFPWRKFILKKAMDLKEVHKLKKQLAEAKAAKATTSPVEGEEPNGCRGVVQPLLSATKQPLTEAAKAT